MMSRIFVLLVAFSALPAFGAASKVQDIEATAAGSATVDLVFAMDVTAGNCLVGGVAWISNTITLTSMVKQAGTATVGATVLLNNPTTFSTLTRGAMFVIPVTGSGTLTLRATTSGTVTKYALAHEATGVAAACTQVGASAMQAQTNPGTGSNALTSGTIGATTASGDYVFGYFIDASGDSTTFTQGTGFTLAVVRTNVEFSEWSGSSAVTAATGTWTSAAADAISGTVAIAAAAGVSGPPAGSRLRMGVGR